LIVGDVLVSQSVHRSDNLVLKVGFVAVHSSSVGFENENRDSSTSDINVLYPVSELHRTNPLQRQNILVSLFARWPTWIDPSTWQRKHVASILEYVPRAETAHLHESMVSTALDVISRSFKTA
tara:strand:+ start:135 stop:503 length:369 start_codon:yes stop_codon:yes gene_type:complete